jgi:hypothetical protein
MKSRGLYTVDTENKRKEEMKKGCVIVVFDGMMPHISILDREANLPGLLQR